MNKLYSVHDHWTDINKKNDVDIESIDGVITGIKVNGEDYGGGGGSSDFSTAEVTVNVIDFEEGAEYHFDYVPKVENGVLMSDEVYVTTATETITIPLAPNGVAFSARYEPESITGNATVTKEGKDYIITVTGDSVLNYRNDGQTSTE